MGFSPEYNELLLSWGLNIGAPSQPTDFYIAFHTADPGTTGSSEAAGIARTQNDLWAIGTAGDGSVQNDGAGETAAVTGAVTVTHFSVWSAETGGTFYFGGPLVESRMVSAGDKIAWAAGDLTAAIS